MNSKARYQLSIATIALGASLLIISVLGQWTGLGNYKSAPPRPGERFDPELVKQTPNLDSLYRVAEQRAGKPFDELPPQEVMESLYGVVADRFTNGAAQHTLFSNWILWSLGQLHPSIMHIRDPEVLVSGGHSLFCDQSSYLLLSLALKAGIRARHVGLDGHVVMEAWYDGNWHLYDPDAEVIAKDEQGRVLSVGDLSKNAGLLQKAYAGRGEDLVNIIATRENNTFMSYPVGSQFEWKSQVLSQVEKAAQFLKFVIPFLLIGFGLIRLKKLRA
jgi:hypothetical protein